MDPWQMLHLALNVNSTAVDRAQKRANTLYHKTPNHEEGMCLAGDELARAVRKILSVDNDVI